MNATTFWKSEANASLRQTIENIFWYFLLFLMAGVTIFPFLWIFFTSFKGPTDAIYSVPPQLIPHQPTFDNYVRVWNLLPVAGFFWIVSCGSRQVVLNLLIHFACGIPFAKMKFPGRDGDFLFAPGNIYRAAPAHIYPQLCDGCQCVSLL